MPETNSPAADIQFVAHPAALEACVARLREHSSLALDLEFDSHRHAYGVTLCLVQLATPESCVIIDPFQAGDLKAFFELCTDAGIQKIMHSPGEDLRLLHSLGCIPQNVFDTEVAAKLLNYEQSSLSAMLEAKLGQALNKGQQCSNWLKRPLSREQIAYAAADVLYLHRLKACLVEEAEARGLMPFVGEEQEALSRVVYPAREKDFFLKAGEARKLSPFDRHVLNGLFAFRDQLAREQNRPAFQILSEPLLRDLFSGTLSPEQIPFMPGVYGRFRHDRFGKQLATRLQELQTEAGQLSLSKRLEPRPRSEREVWSKRELQEAHEKLFMPIQKELEARYGTHAARYLLSNALVTKILRKTTSLSELPSSYRQQLISGIAAQKGIDLSAYEGPVPQDEDYSPWE